MQKDLKTLSFHWESRVSSAMLFFKPWLAESSGSTLVHSRWSIVADTRLKKSLGKQHWLMVDSG